MAVGLVAFSMWRPDQKEVDFDPLVAMEIVNTHCVTCHSASPSSDMFDEPPADIAFDDLSDIRIHASKMVAQAVLSNTMPLGNETGMTAEERVIMGSWLRAGAPAE